ncbi:MAG: FecR domain-containing protein [Caulobacteraceae bacterium]
MSDVFRQEVTDVTALSPEDAAAFWLVKRDRYGPLESDPRFGAWLKASESHADAWARACRVWDDLDVGADPLLDVLRRDALVVRRPRGSARAWGLVAACSVGVFLAVAGGLHILGSTAGLSTPRAAIPISAPPTFSTATGPPSGFALPDGDKVTLDANSALAVAYTGHKRTVRLLRGQAYFNITHDPARPFVAEIGLGSLVDIGTTFDLRRDGGGFSVILVKGAVAVTSGPGSAPQSITPGQRLDAQPGEANRVTSVDVDQALAWRTGFLEFRDQPLCDAIAAVNQYGGKQARIVDSAVQSMRVSGRFQTGDPSRFARTLSEIYPLAIRERPGGGVDIAHR